MVKISVKLMGIGEAGIDVFAVQCKSGPANARRRNLSYSKSNVLCVVRIFSIENAYKYWRKA